jgi:hypothetical protein
LTKIGYVKNPIRRKMSNSQNESSPFLFLNIEKVLKDKKGELKNWGMSFGVEPAGVPKGVP